MKNFLILGIAIAALVFISSPSLRACEGEAHAGEKAQSGRPEFHLSEAGKSKAVFQITGMSCQSCEKAITASLKKVNGVQAVTFKKKSSQDAPRLAEVSLKSGVQVDPAQLIQAVEAAGYHASAID